jgi:hypothetical protein
MKRHQEPGEATAAEVFEKLGWRREFGYWIRDVGGSVIKFSAGVAARLWEDQGPRKLELIVRQKMGE